MNEENKAVAALPCEVVRDLLPLYHDKVVSDGTAAAVKAHLDTCQGCRAEYESLCADLPDQQKGDSTGKKFKALMDRQKLKKLMAIVLAVVLTAAAVSGGIAGLSQWYIVPLSADEVEVEDVCPIDTPEGKKVFVRWSYAYGGSSANTSRISNSGHTVSIEMKHPVLEWVSVKGHERSAFWFVSVEEEIDTVTFNGETVWTAEDETRKSPGYVQAFWDWEQARYDPEGGAAGYAFADDYVYLLFPDGHEEYWSYDGERLDEPPASSRPEMDWSLEAPPPAADVFAEKEAPPPAAE